MKKHRVVAMLLSFTMILTLGGCKSDEDIDPLMKETKESLVKMVNDMNTELVDCYTKISDLETMLKGVQGEEEPTSAISEMSDGTGRLTFNTVDGMITLPVPFNYPNAQQAPNTASINVSDAVKVTPTSNWTAVLTGTKLELSHTSGIAGTITVGLLDRDAQKVQTSELQEHMTQWFTNLPPETIKYTRLYLNDNWLGIDATSHTFIDEKDAMIRCGIAKSGENSLQYFFVYSGEQDVAKDEVVLSLIKTISVWNNKLSVE